MKSQEDMPRVGDMLLSVENQLGMTIGIYAKHLYSQDKAIAVEWYLKGKIVGETYIYCKSKREYSNHGDMFITKKEYMKMRNRFREKQKELIK